MLRNIDPRNFNHSSICSTPKGTIGVLEVCLATATKYNMLKWDHRKDKRQKTGYFPKCVFIINKYG